MDLFNIQVSNTKLEIINKINKTNHSARKKVKKTLLKFLNFCFRNRFEVGDKVLIQLKNK